MPEVVVVEVDVDVVVLVVAAAAALAVNPPLYKVPPRIKLANRGIIVIFFMLVI
ncbi:hypothetical protein MKN04_19165 [Paenibacillus polymyxa]|uniref:hypothetical protein n=1 Tax=Paenibacillus polymyxa TaxID=1406 RepID=UPI000AAB24CA|nr:hypothetical protein [Paenibacillus polymyxa]MCH6189768.1 hypothetical protein [Paenibacillus polymyxa]WRL61116.1 hypothetical protein U3G77_23985 [Paenibacillus polymyxa]